MVWVKRSGTCPQKASCMVSGAATIRPRIRSVAPIPAGPWATTVAPSVHGAPS